MKDNGVPEQLGRASTASMGAMFMWLFIGSLSILFICSLIVYLIFRGRAPQWPPAEFPALPEGLWISTVLIIASSLSLHFSVLGLRAARVGQCVALLRLTLGLGLLFIVLQLVNWFQVYSQGLVISSQFGGMFYFMTVLHALHVFGGLIGLLVTTQRASRGAYKPDYYPGLGLLGIYWHFLAVLWLVLFAVLKGTA